MDALVRHGEDDLVERKRQPPSGTKFGATVASFANAFGGWILIGIADDGSVPGWQIEPAKTDLQSHLGHLLRGQVDPVPPFVASYREYDGATIAVMRVFESSDVPHVERGTGAIYVRTSAGKTPVDSHAGVLALAQRGRDAEDAARRRLTASWIVQTEVSPPDADPRRIARSSDPDCFTVLVRAASLTVSPAFVEWPISGAGADACYRVLERTLPSSSDSSIIRPRARGLAARKDVDIGLGRGKLRATAIADSIGVVAVEMRRPADTFLELHELRRVLMRPAIDAVCDLLEDAEAIGRAAVDLWLSCRKDVIVGGIEEKAPVAMDFHVASEITTPADDVERSALGRRWEREIARELGKPRWEDEEDGDSTTE